MRVALARAVYSRADVFLFDDPLAAVDAHVGQHIFDSLFCNALSSATRVLVTNAVQYLASPAVERVVVLERGAIVADGSYASLLHLESGSSVFRALVEARLGAASCRVVAPGPLRRTRGPAGTVASDTQSESAVALSGQSPQLEGNGAVSKVVTDAVASGKLVTVEHRGKGSIARGVYLTWLRDMGPLPLVIYAILCFVLAEGCALALDLW